MNELSVRIIGYTGKQQCATGTEGYPVVSQVESADASIRVTLHADNKAHVEFGTKTSVMGIPQYHALHTYDLNDVKGIKHHVHRSLVSE